MNTPAALVAIQDAMTRRDVAALEDACRGVDLALWHACPSGEGHAGGNPVFWFFQDFLHAPELLPVLLRHGAPLFMVAPVEAREHWTARLGRDGEKNHSLALTPFLLLLEYVPGRGSRRDRYQAMATYTPFFLDPDHQPQTNREWVMLFRTSVRHGQASMVEKIAVHPLPRLDLAEWDELGAEARMHVEDRKEEFLNMWGSISPDHARFAAMVELVLQKGRLAALVRDADAPSFPRSRL